MDQKAEPEGTAKPQPETNWWHETVSVSARIFLPCEEVSSGGRSAAWLDQRAGSMLLRHRGRRRGSPRCGPRSICL